MNTEKTEARSRRGHWILRVAGLAAFALVGWQAGSVVGRSSEQPRGAIIGIIAGIVLGLALTPLVIERPYFAIRRILSSVPVGDLLYSTIGLIIGLIIAALLSYPLSFLPWWFGHLLPAIAALVCAYAGVSLMLMRHRELSKFISSRFAGQGRDDQTLASSSSGGLLLDTSAIIDGRIADISQTGFLRGTLIVPQFVLHELQNIAGSSDPLRRARGRRGLDVLNRLQRDSKTPVEVIDMDARDIPDVDSKLVKLARDMECPVITNDFNLNKVAEIQGVLVLNINQLANALKPVVLPGEEMGVRIIQEGRELNQGVAYLDDGTMIVVENGRRHLHANVEVVVTRVLQTVAGRMIFAQLKSNGSE